MPVYVTLRRLNGVTSCWIHSLLLDAKFLGLRLGEHIQIRSFIRPGMHLNSICEWNVCNRGRQIYVCFRRSLQLGYPPLS